MRRLTLILLLTVPMTILLTGCLGSKETGPEIDPAPLPPPPPPAATIKAQELWPAKDMALSFSIKDANQPVPYRVDEYLLREEGSAVAVQAGNTYATWHITEDGIHRLDPKGGGVLLLYLPETVQDGQVWKQTSGSQDVWFKTVLGPGDCKGIGNQPCWDLTVLNRGEKTLFRFAPGYGPIRVISENFPAPAESFEKVKTADGPSQLSPEHRAQAIAASRPPTQEKPFAVESTLADFDAAVASASGTR